MDLSSIDGIVQLSLLENFRTGNILLDTLFRSLVIGTVVGWLTTISMTLKHWFTDTLEWAKGNIRGFSQKSVRLVGTSIASPFGRERFNFSITFKAVLEHILRSRVKEANSNDISNLREFQTELDIKYDEYDQETYCYSYSFILDQSKPIFVAQDLYAMVITKSVDEDRGSDGKVSDGVIAKQYEIVLSSKSLSCKEIVNWIEECVESYQQQRLDAQKGKRFILKLMSASRGGSQNDSGSQALEWDIDQLADHYTFDSLFFEGKEDVLRTINKFVQERSFYEKVGKPWTLGINLSGPPGCGKTSFIRALSQHLKRNIKDISFSKIKTNKEFESAMKCVSYEGKSLKPEETILIAEDIDCANQDAVRRRESYSDSRHTDVAYEVEGIVDEVEVQSVGNDCQTREESLILQALSNEARSTSKRLEKMDKDIKKEQDVLDLSTILNALDGIKTGNGRVLVFTTNHPEKLDPALLRPGRIDLNVVFGPLKRELAKEMCFFWFEKYSEFYRRPELLLDFDQWWDEHCGTDEKFPAPIRPCVIHNILQQAGDDVNLALANLAKESCDLINDRN